MWVLLLRAVNLGPANKLAMKDLKAVLEELGHSDVRTYLNSGNATFRSTRRSALAMCQEVEQALKDRVGLDVRACLRRDTEISRALAELPKLPGYVVVNVLFEPPTPAALHAFLSTDWLPDVVSGNDRVLYVGFADAARTRLSNAAIEKALGVRATARTPATLRRVLGMPPAP